MISLPEDIDNGGILYLSHWSSFFNLKKCLIRLGDGSERNTIRGYWPIMISKVERDNRERGSYIEARLRDCSNCNQPEIGLCSSHRKEKTRPKFTAKIVSMIVSFHSDIMPLISATRELLLVERHNTCHKCQNWTPPGSSENEENLTILV